MPTDNPKSDRSPQTHVYGFPLSDDEKGKCNTCGFLRLEVNAKSGTDYREIGWRKRLGGDQIFDLIYADKEEAINPLLECLVGLRNPQEETAEEASKKDSKYFGDFDSAALIVLDKDIKCPKWQPYNPGKPIQQYYAEDFMQRLEELRQQFQIDGEKRQQALEESLSKAQMEAQERTNKTLEGMAATTAGLKTMAENIDISSRRYNKLVLWLTVLIILETAVLGGLQVYFASRSPQPIVIQQQPTEQPTQPNSNSSQ